MTLCHILPERGWVNMINYYKMDYRPEAVREDPKDPKLVCKTKSYSIPRALVVSELTCHPRGPSKWQTGSYTWRAWRAPGYSQVLSVSTWNCVVWPGLSKQIAEKVGKCSVCEKERKCPPEPLLPSRLPDYPWQKVGMDMFKLKGHIYLIIIDYYSRCKTTSGCIVNNCKSVFSRNGIPELVISDNGPQFT